MLDNSGPKGSRLGSVGGGGGVWGPGVPTSGSGSQVMSLYIYSRARVVAKWTKASNKVRTFIGVLFGRVYNPLFHLLQGTNGIP